MKSNTLYQVSGQGITLTDNARKLFFRKHYNVSQISHCGVDPEDRRWDIIPIMLVLQYICCICDFNNKNVPLRWSLKSSDGSLSAPNKLFAFVARKAASRACNQVDMIMMMMMLMMTIMGVYLCGVGAQALATRFITSEQSSPSSLYHFRNIKESVSKNFLFLQGSVKHQQSSSSSSKTWSKIFQCHVFAELDLDQPARAIVNFVNKLMMSTSNGSGGRPADMV